MRDQKVGLGDNHEWQLEQLPPAHEEQPEPVLLDCSRGLLD